MAVSIYAANVVSWTFAGLAIILTWARYHARYMSPRGFLWDDLLHGLALIFLLVEISTFFVALRISPSIDAYEDHKTDVVPDYAKFQRLLLVWRTMVWSCVWAVKFGYLVLYRDIFGKTSSRFRIAWWVVVVFNFLSYWAAVAATFVYCGGSAANLLNEQICDSESVDMLQYHYLIYGGVLNIVTDLSVMALPLAMLRSIPLDRVQKVGLAIIFSLSFAEIVAESVRIAESRPAIGSQANNFLVTSLESSVAVWLSCVPSLHYIFQTRTSRRRSSDSFLPSEALGGSRFGSISASLRLPSWKESAKRKKSLTPSSSVRSIMVSRSDTDATITTDSFDQHLRKIDQFRADERV